MIEQGHKQYLGKYRGMVVNNIDPQQIGRLLVQVPDVLTLTPSSWAMPCVPIPGKQMGIFVLPPIGARVWVEFENGDPSYPIWTGGWWETAAEVPALALAAPPIMQNVVLQTQGQHTVMLSDVPGPTGGILLKTSTGASISISDTGIIIQNGRGASIVMTQNIVAINGTALTVM